MSLQSLLSCYPPPPDLHSFPTRRSSDLSAETTSTQSPAYAIAYQRDRTDQCRQGGHEPNIEVLDHPGGTGRCGDRKSTRLNSSHVEISYAVFCLKKKKKQSNRTHVAAPA